MEINGGGGGGANKLDSQNLRDLLRIKQENYQNDLRAAVSGITLDALLSEERSHVPPVINEPPQQQRLQSNRTLLDVIRDESEAATRRDNTRRWRHFKSKLRLRRNQSLPASGIVSNNHINNRIMIEAEERRGMREEEEEERQPARMSLMELLEETDKKMEYSMSEEVEAAEIVGGEVDYNNCCVCMVRNKGSAFIPCGHTFCRLCSRELWVQRGSCPICNNSIVEILDIF